MRKRGGASKAELASLGASTLLLVVALLSAPTVTPDSWQYLNSAQAMLMMDPRAYFWVREPFYPAFAGISILTGSLMPLVIIQLVAQVASLHFLSRMLIGMANERKHRFLWLVSAVSQATLVGYATFVGQQSLAITLMALFSMVLLSEKSKNWGFIWILPIPLFSLVAWGLSSIYGFVLALTVLGVALTRFSGSNLWRRFLPGVVATLMVLAPHLAWSQLKEFVIEQNSMSGDSQFSDRHVESPFAQVADALPNFPPYSQAVISNFFANLDLVPTNGWFFSYQEEGSSPGHPHGTLGVGPLIGWNPLCEQPGSSAITDGRMIVGLFIDECDERPFQLIKAVSIPLYLLIHISWLLLAVTFLLTWVPRILNFRVHMRNPLFPLAMLSLALPAAYALFGGGIARYGVPVFHIMAVLAALRIVERIEKPEWSSRLAKRPHESGE